MFYDSHLNKSVSQLDQVLKSVHLKNIAVHRLVLETFLSNIRLDKESEQCSLWAMSIPGKNYNFTLIQNQVLKSVINIACGDSDHFNSSDRPMIPWWTEALERCCLSPQRPSNAPCRNFKGDFRCMENTQRKRLFFVLVLSWLLGYDNETNSITRPAYRQTSQRQGFRCPRWSRSSSARCQSSGCWGWVIA